jgi:uncharacterized protein (TIGR02466 family)
MTSHNGVDDTFARRHHRPAMSDDQIKPIFPTSIMVRHLDGMADTNRALAALICGLEQTERNGSFGTSTKGGYQTPENLLRADHPQAASPALLILKQHIAAAMQAYARLLIGQECIHPPSDVQFSSWGWGVILRGGNWQGHHVHPGAHISGVYYVAAPPAALMGDTDAGKISFFDPRPRANMSQLLTQATRHMESPTPGDMVLFPSWLEHSVAPFEGEGERICIAFNVQLTMS